MKSFVKFWRLPTGERFLLLSAFFYLAAARIALWVFPLQKIVKRAETLKVSKTFSASPEKIASAIGVVSRRLPGLRNCLVQALAGQVFLARQGHISQIRIGVARKQDGQFQAHAWVEYAGQIIIGGGAGVSQFTVLPPLEFQHEKR